MATAIEQLTIEWPFVSSSIANCTQYVESNYHTTPAYRMLKWCTENILGWQTMYVDDEMIIIPDLLLRICQENTPISTIKVQSWAAWHGYDKEPTVKDDMLHFDCATLGQHWIYSDVRLPVILLDGYLVDGRHRLYKAYKDEVESIECYSLSS
jgi:hypothetical protein